MSINQSEPTMLSTVTISALLMLSESEHWQSLNQVHTIALDNIAYRAWSDWRTEALRVAYSPHQEFDPIKVTGFKINGQIFFDVSDGNHRCHVRAINGHDDITAEIKGIYTIHPDAFHCKKTRYGIELWHEHPDHHRLITDAIDDVDGLAQALASLGVSMVAE